MSLKVSACSHGIAGGAIFFIAIRVPACVANLLDERCGDAITLYGEGVIGVRKVTSFDILEQGVDILWNSGRGRKCRRDLFPHVRPHQAQPLHVGRLGSSPRVHGGKRLLERTDFIDDMAGAAHGAQDFIGDRRTSNGAKAAGKASRHRRVRPV
ncbi:MAG: hypothetical protein ACREP8_13945 [Candidatus Binatia bacterium]